MPLVLVLALLVPIIFTASLLLHRRFEETAPLVLMGLAVLFYFLGCIGVLAVGRVLMWLLWLLSVGYLVWVLLVKRQHEAAPRSKLQGVALGADTSAPGGGEWNPLRGIQKTHFTAGMVLFVVMCAALWWLCRGRRYANWDEFSHWGRALKAVFQQNVLPAVAAVKDEFKEYPPGLAPLQAVLMQTLNTGFREDVAIYLQGVFSVALLVYPLRSFSQKLQQIPAGLLVGTLLFVSPTMAFWNYYTETTVDGLLGVLFAFVLMVQALGKRTAYERALQCLALALLPLVKASGLLLAVLACVVVFAGQVAASAHGPRREKATEDWNLWHLLPLGSLFMAYFSWQLFMEINRVPRRWNAGTFSFSALWQLLGYGQPAWRAETAKFYFANVFGDFNYGWPVGFLPYVGFFVIFVGVWLLLRLVFEGRDRKAFNASFWAMLGGGVLYLFLMLGSYLFVFSEYEAVRLASLSRYLNTWVCAMTVFLMGWLARALAEREPGVRKTVSSLVVATLLWVFLGNPAIVLGTFIKAPTMAAHTANVQRRYDVAAAAIRAVDSGAEPKIYVVAIDDLGLTLLRLDYALVPQYLPDHFSSIGPDYAEDDLMSLRITVDEWEKMLEKDYEYVYLLDVNDRFATVFGSLFDNRADIYDGVLLRVVERSGKLRLERVS